MSIKRSFGNVSGVGSSLPSSGDGATHTISPTRPSSPSVGDVWVNPEAAAASSLIVAGEMRKTAIQNGFSVKQKVTWDAQMYDTNGSIIDLSNNKLIVPLNGLWRVGGQLDVTNGSSAYIEIQLYKNGSHLLWIYRGEQGAPSEFRPWSAFLQLAQNDYLEMYALMPAGSWYQIRETSTFGIAYQGGLA